MDESDIYGDLNECGAETEKKGREVGSLWCGTGKLEQPDSDSASETMDDFDIYGDLDKCDAEAEKQSREVQSLLCRIAELEQQVQNKEQQKCEVLNKNSVLLENISSLLLTAKAELKRKDTIIADLRKQCDNALFRRGSHSTRDHSSNRASNTHNRGTQTVSVHSKHAGVQVELAMEDDYQERKRKCVRGHEEEKNRSLDHKRDREREQDRRCEKYSERDREKDRGKDREKTRYTERGRDRANARDRNSDKYRVRDSEKERDREKYAQRGVWGRDQSRRSRDRHRDRDDFSMQSGNARDQRSSERDHHREGKYRDRPSIVFSNSAGTHSTREDIKVFAAEKRALESNSKESITQEKQRRKEKSSTLLVQNEMHKTSSHRDISTQLEDVHVKKERDTSYDEIDAKVHKVAKRNKEVARTDDANTSCINSNTIPAFPNIVTDVEDCSSDVQKCDQLKVSSDSTHFATDPGNTTEYSHGTANQNDLNESTTANLEMHPTSPFAKQSSEDTVTDSKPVQEGAPNEMEVPRTENTDTTRDDSMITDVEQRSSDVQSSANPKQKATGGRTTFSNDSGPIECLKQTTSMNDVDQASAVQLELHSTSPIVDTPAEENPESISKSVASSNSETSSKNLEAVAVAKRTRRKCASSPQKDKHAVFQEQEPSPLASTTAIATNGHTTTESPMQQPLNSDKVEQNGVMKQTAKNLNRQDSEGSIQKAADAVGRLGATKNVDVNDNRTLNCEPETSLITTGSQRRLRSASKAECSITPNGVSERKKSEIKIRTLDSEKNWDEEPLLSSPAKCLTKPVNLRIAQLRKEAASFIRSVEKCKVSRLEGEVFGFKKPVASSNIEKRVRKSPLSGAMTNVDSTVVIPMKDPTEPGVIDEGNKSEPQFETDDENVSMGNSKESLEPRSNGENIEDVTTVREVADETVKPASGSVGNELQESESVAASIGNAAVEDQSSAMQIPEPAIESNKSAPVESENLVGPSSNTNPSLTPLQSYFMSFSKEYEWNDTDEVPNSTSLLPSANVMEENKKEELFKATRTDLSLTDSVPYYIAKNSNAVFTNLKSGLSQQKPQNKSLITNSNRLIDESRSTKSIDTLEAMKSLSSSNNSSTDARNLNRKRRISLDASSALSKRPKTDNNSADSQLSTTTLSSTYFSSISLPIVSALDYDQASATKRRSSTNLNSPIRPTPMVVLHSPAKSLGTPLKHAPMSESDFDANSSIQLIMDSLLQTPIKSETIDGEAEQGSSITHASPPRTVDTCFDESLNLGGFENKSGSAVKLEPCEENTSPGPSDARQQNEKSVSLKCDKQQKRELKIVRKNKVLNKGDAHCRTVASSSPSGEKNELKTDHNNMIDVKTTDGKSNGLAAGQPNRKRVPPAEGKAVVVCDHPAQDQSSHVGKASSCKENENVDQPEEQQNEWVKKESILRQHGQYHTPEGPVNFVREMRVVKESPTYMRVYITRRKV